MMHLRFILYVHTLALAGFAVLVTDVATLQSSWYMSILCFASLFAASMLVISTEEGSWPGESTLVVYHSKAMRIWMPIQTFTKTNATRKTVNLKYDVGVSPCYDPSERSTIESTIAPTLQHDSSCSYLG